MQKGLLSNAPQQPRKPGSPPCERQEDQLGVPAGSKLRIRLLPQLEGLGSPLSSPPYHPQGQPAAGKTRSVFLSGSVILEGNLKPGAWELKVTRWVQAECHMKRKPDTQKVEGSLAPKDSPEPGEGKILGRRALFLSPLDPRWTEGTWLPLWRGDLSSGSSWEEGKAALIMFGHKEEGAEGLGSLLASGCWPSTLSHRPLVSGPALCSDLGWANTDFPSLIP